MRSFLSMIAALSLCACFHARRVEKPDEGAATSSGEGEQPTRKEGRRAGSVARRARPEEPGRLPLAASPEGLLVPGGVEKVQEALAARGYLDLDSAERGKIDVATSAALRKFQADQGIARTGNPDHETVRRLGLDPGALFRKSATVQDSK
jgi:hypothetical protein